MQSHTRCAVLIAPFDLPQLEKIHHGSMVWTLSHQDIEIFRLSP